MEISKKLQEFIEENMNIIEKNSDLKVINMNLALSSASKYFFSFSVAFYFSYAYFALKKLLVREEF